MLLSIHVAAGGLALVLGAVALLAKKGGTIHRRSGLLFVYAMLVMGASASILGILESHTDGNVFAGLMTAYFVGTALTTVRPVTPWTSLNHPSQQLPRLHGQPSQQHPAKGERCLMLDGVIRANAASGIAATNGRACTTSATGMITIRVTARCATSTCHAARSAICLWQISTRAHSTAS